MFESSMSVLLVEGLTQKFQVHRFLSQLSHWPTGVQLWILLWCPRLEEGTIAGAKKDRCPRPEEKTAWSSIAMETGTPITTPLWMDIIQAMAGSRSTIRQSAGIMRRRSSWICKKRARACVPTGTYPGLLIKNRRARLCRALRLLLWNRWVIWSA